MALPNLISTTVFSLSNHCLSHGCTLNERNSLSIKLLRLFESFYVETDD